VGNIFSLLRAASSGAGDHHNGFVTAIGIPPCREHIERFELAKIAAFRAHSMI